MDDETDVDNPVADSESVTGGAPMHYLFEIELMTSEIVAESGEGNRTGFDLRVKTRHVRKYLVDYYKKHATLPIGRHYLGMTRPLNLEIGMIDLGAIRQKIRTDSEKWKAIGNGSRAVAEVATDKSPGSEDEGGMRWQKNGAEPERRILDLRRERSRREKKSGRRG